jgi:hypothetical protein
VAIATRRNLWRLQLGETCGDCNSATSVAIATRQHLWRLQLGETCGDCNSAKPVAIATRQKLRRLQLGKSRGDCNSTEAVAIASRQKPWRLQLGKRHSVEVISREERRENSFYEKKGFIDYVMGVRGDVRYGRCLPRQAMSPRPRPTI